MVMMHLSWYPLSLISLTASCMLSMVGVISVLRHTTSAHPSCAEPDILAGGTSFPRSSTRNPPAVSMVLTMFFPISCTSPWTTAVTAFFVSPRSPFGIAGRSTSSPSYMLCAATSTCGRYMVWFA